VQLVGLLFCLAVVLVIVLKDSLRTYFKSLIVLGGQILFLVLGGQVMEVLVLGVRSLSLEVRSLSLWVRSLLTSLPSARHCPRLAFDWRFRN